MAYANITRTASASFQGRLAAALLWARVGIDRRRLYNRTFRELSALSDRELADLGIHRLTIAEIARQAAYGN